MSPLARLLRSQRGFSVTELMVVCAVLGVLMAGLIAIQQAGTSAYVIGSTRVTAQQNARFALEMMVRELRSAQAITALSGTTDITFTDENNSVLRYQYNSGSQTLTRSATGCAGCTGAVIPVIGGVTAFNITCYSAFNNYTGTGTTTATASAVRAIRVQVTTGSEVAVASYADANQHSVMESWVRLRNL